MNVGFIGIGEMGKHMSRHVIEAGYDLSVHDVSKEAAQHLVEKGARWAGTPRGMAESCQVVLSCLPGPHEVEEVVYGTNGLMAGWKKGDIYVDMSTNSPTTIRRVAADAKAMGVAVLDAPVSGGILGAEAGTLSIMVGGDEHSLKKVRDILEAIGDKIFHVGDVGHGNIAKLVNNMIAITCNNITAEGFILGVKAGIDPKKLWDIISVSTANNYSLQQYPRVVFQGKFDDGFKLSLACKDIGLAVNLGKEYNVPLPVSTAVEQRFIEAKAAGLGEKNIYSIILRLEELTGVQVRSKEQ